MLTRAAFRCDAVTNKFIIMKYYDVLRSWFLRIFYIIFDIIRRKSVEQRTIDRVSFRPTTNCLIREVVETVAGAESFSPFVGIRSPPRFFGNAAGSYTEFL